MALIQEFKNFAMKGNVVDMAVGIIIGGGFQKIVNSMVGDIIMPVVGALGGNGSFGTRYLWLGEGPKPATIESAKEMGEPYIAWGPFLQTTLDFVILAFVIFMIVKLMNKARGFGHKPDKEQAAAAPPEDIVLLREIRDALKAG